LIHFYKRVFYNFFRTTKYKMVFQLKSGCIYRTFERRSACR